MEFWQRFATGAVLHVPDDGVTVASPGGTCAAYRTRRHWITAKHCVPEVEGTRIAVMYSGESHPVYFATRIDRHPSADLAVIHIPDHEVRPPFEGQFFLPREGLIDGGDFVGFGYPMGSSAPAERIIKGHFQRYFQFDSASGGSYFAGEMNVPVPGGFSGGVLSYQHALNEAVAVATTSVDSMITVESVSSVDDDGKRYEETTSKIHSYGIALLLTGFIPWLEDIVQSS